MLLSYFTVEADPTIRIEVNNTSVQPGETMQFTCVAANLKGGTSFLRIQKDVIGTDTPVDTLVLATNTILSKNLDAIDRYMIAFAQGVNSDELRFTFTITGKILKMSYDNDFFYFQYSHIFTDHIFTSQLFAIPFLCTIGGSV